MINDLHNFLNDRLRASLRIYLHFSSKGEVVIHSEISFFVYKHDLKQSQIARMAGKINKYIYSYLKS